MSTTVAAAILDPNSEWRWLLDLTYRGAHYRFATAPSDYDGKVWRSGLIVDSEPETTVDPYEGSAEVTQAGLRLLPVPDDPTDPTPFRPYDIGADDPRAWQSMTAVLYRWPVDSTDAQEILRGVVCDPSITAEGEVEVTLKDFTLQYQQRLSPSVVQAAEYTDLTLPDDVHGLTFPILFGTFVDSRCIIVNEASPYWVVASTLGLIAAGLSFGDVTIKIDGVADTIIVQSAGSTRGIDARWYVRATSNTTGTSVTAAGTGIKDDTAGTYSGTSVGTITHPADQLHCLARAFAGIPVALIDKSSFAAMRGALAGWSFSIMTEAGAEDSFFAVAAEVGYWLRSVVLHERGKLRMRDLSFTRRPVLPLVRGENLLRRGGIVWGDPEPEVATKIELSYRYQWDEVKQEYAYAASHTIDGRNDTYDLTVNEDIGGKPISKETRHLYDATTAARCGERIRELVQQPRSRMKSVVVDRTGHDLRIYDVVSVTDETAPSSDGAGYAAKNHVVIGIKYGLETSELTLLEA